MGAQRHRVGIGQHLGDLHLAIFIDNTLKDHTGPEVVVKAFEKGQGFGRQRELDICGLGDKTVEFVALPDFVPKGGTVEGFDGRRIHRVCQHVHGIVGRAIFHPIHHRDHLDFGMDVAPAG